MNNVDCEEIIFLIGIYMHIAHMYNVDCEEKKAKMNVCTSATCFKPLAK